MLTNTSYDPAQFMVFMPFMQTLARKQSSHAVVYLGNNYNNFSIAAETFISQSAAGGTSVATR